MIFSSFTWFGAVGTSVTFTATQPPGTPPFMAPPSILIGSGEPPQQSVTMPGPPLPPLPSTLASGGGGDSRLAAWQIGLVVGLVLGVSLLLGLLLLFLLWRRHCCFWGHKDGEIIKVLPTGFGWTRVWAGNVHIGGSNHAVRGLYLPLVLFGTSARACCRYRPDIF